MGGEEPTELANRTSTHHGHRVPAARADGSGIHGLHLSALEKVVGSAVDLYIFMLAVGNQRWIRNAAHPDGVMMRQIRSVEGGKTAERPI